MPTETILMQDGTQNNKSYLSNTCRILTDGVRKLTLGYLGGSITLGSSAATDGTLADSWVNQTTAWFENWYPDRVIEAVNAGVSDTATNFGLFRLRECLMNTNGHDMPDVVFVEFCNNDWIYPAQSIAHLEGQIESLFRNIYQLNPYAEIVVVCTARGENNYRAAYVKVAEAFDIPVLDVGIALANAIKESGHTESNGDFYYTIDNLHPSAKGYHVYFEVVKEFLEENLAGLKLQNEALYDYKAHAPQLATSYYIDAPAIHAAGLMKLSGKATVLEKPLSVPMFGTARDKAASVALTPSIVHIDGKATVETVFSGGVLGLLFHMKKEDILLTYSIDGGNEIPFGVNDNAFGFQRYDHPQVFMLGHDFGAGTHTLKLTFPENSSIYFAGILANDGQR